jgi:hypothetical protein
VKPAHGGDAHLLGPIRPEQILFRGIPVFRCFGLSS